MQAGRQFPSLSQQEEADMVRVSLPVFAPLLMLPPAAALAHGDALHGSRRAPIDYSDVEEKAFGQAADPKRAARTIRIVGTDDMRYAPAEIRAGEGETVRLLVGNEGEMPHEIVLGTMAEFEQHYELMKKFPGMEHDEPQIVHLKPGETG